MDHRDLEQRLQGEINALVSGNEDVFSAVLGVCGPRGDFHWAGAAGSAYPDKHHAMEVDTPVFIASITKMYTAAVTMILEERGLISLNDPLSKFFSASILTGLHIYKGHDYSDQLRIYHLISQTSGLPDYFEESPKGASSLLDRLIAEGDVAWGLADVVRITNSGLSPKFSPESKDQATTGKKAHYSDTNYQLLGAIIEEAAQKSLAELLSELIIDPLSLSSTYLFGSEQPHGIARNPPATIYFKNKPLHLNKAMVSFGPDGGMVSTVEDSLKFIKHFMDGALFLSPSTLERMKSWRTIFFPFQYGFGLMRFKLPRILSPFSASPELIGHAGASSAFLFYSPDDNIYIAGTLNQLDKRRRPYNLMLKIIKIVGQQLS